MKFEDCFKGKTVLVTGAGRGIGRILCKRLDEIGANVYALSRTKSTLDSLEEENPKIKTICLDVSNWEATQNAIQPIPHLDFLVNNAGVMVLGNFLDMTSETIDRAMDINLKSVVNTSQIVAKKMIERGQGGSIVNVSSLGAKVVGPGFIPYCLSKAALEMLTKSMANELGPHKIRVNSVNPGVIMNDMGKDLMKNIENPAEIAKTFLNRCPMKRSPTETEVVNTILVLLSNFCAMTTGESLLIDGGLLTT